MLSLSLGLISIAACGEVEPAAAPVGSRAMNQLSGGPGVSVYDFVVDGDRVGSVMVTDGAWGPAYSDQYEFWLWDYDAADKLRDGDIDDLEIHVALQEDHWIDSAADIFEANTDGWIAYAVPRQFALQSQPREAKEDKKKERFVYQLDAPAWGEMQGTISYYVEIDFEKNEDIPRMEWLVDAEDLKTYYYSEMTDEDMPEFNDCKNPDHDHYYVWNPPPSVSENIDRWEVRLTQDATLTRVHEAWAYELTTLYPAQ